MKRTLDAAFWKTIDADTALLEPPPPAAVLETIASRLGFPPSLRAMYAAHDGSEGATPLFSEDIVDRPLAWWKLADVEDLGRVELGGRAYIPFASGTDEEDQIDESEVVAMDAESEEIVFLKMAEAEVRKIADDALGIMVLEEPSARVSPVSPVSEEERRAAASLVKILVEKGLIELRADVSQGDFALAVARTLQAEKTGLPKLRIAALVDLMEDPMVEEIYADDDTLKRLFREFV